MFFLNIFYCLSYFLNICTPIQYNFYFWWRWIFWLVKINERAKSRGSRGSCGSFWWVILVGQTRGSFWWVILVGQTSGLNLWVKLASHSRGSNSRVILAGHSRGSNSWSFLVIHCHWSFLCLELLGTLRCQNCPKMLVRLWILVPFSKNSNIYDLLNAFLFFLHSSIFFSSGIMEFYPP